MRRAPCRCTARHLGVVRLLLDVFAALPSGLARSLSWDQGRETACHLDGAATGMPVYFRRRSSRWQRGSNENMNGLLPQYFAKGSDMSVHSVEHLKLVAAELNARPRKTLGWRTPAAVHADLHSPLGAETDCKPKDASEVRCCAFGRSGRCGANSEGA